MDLGGKEMWRGYHLISFPVKYHWHEPASLELIEQSAALLELFAARQQWKRVVVPRPGCGNGGLEWKDVKPIIESYFDERFIVVHL